MNVLVAWDPAVSHDCFLNWLHSCAWPPDTAFYVVTVLAPLPALVPDFDNELIARASSRIERCAAGLQAKGLQAQGMALQGDPGSVLVSEAARLHANLILMGAPASARPLHLMTGAVARRVLRFAHCSVQICRRNPDIDKDIDQAAAGTGLRVLVPVDGSDYSKAAVDSLTLRPWPAHTVFEVVSVVEPVSASVKYLYPGYNERAEAVHLRAVAMQHAQDAIKSAELTLAAAGLKVMDTVMVPLAAPGELIIEEAARWQADLIVLGSHGRRGVTRFLLGSISEAVALHAGCSVEVYRHPAAATP